MRVNKTVVAIALACLVVGTGIVVDRRDREAVFNPSEVTLYATQFEFNEPGLEGSTAWVLNYFVWPGYGALGTNRAVLIRGDDGVQIDEWNDRSNKWDPIAFLPPAPSGHAEGVDYEGGRQLEAGETVRITIEGGPVELCQQVVRLLPPKERSPYLVPGNVMTVGMNDDVAFQPWSSTGVETWDLFNRPGDIRVTIHPKYASIFAPGYGLGDPTAAILLDIYNVPRKGWDRLATVRPMDYLQTPSRWGVYSVTWGDAVVQPGVCVRLRTILNGVQVDPLFHIVAKLQ
jgi:hypothetical protein